MSIRMAKRMESIDSSKVSAAFGFSAAINNPIDLSIGFPEDDTPAFIKSAGITAIQKNHTRYTPANGLSELRQAIVEKLWKENHIKTDKDRVSVTPGLTSAIFLCYLAILDPGDEIIIPEPYFPPHKQLAAMLGARVRSVDLFPTFQLTAKLLERQISAKTKAIVINSPNNPTGAIYPKAELAKIAELAKKHDLLIITDEIYEYFVYDEPQFSIGSIYENTITLNGFSKSYGMTGWRLGYVNGPIEVIEAINQLLQYTIFSSSSISQYAGIKAIRSRPKSLARKYKSKRDFANKILIDCFDVQAAQGAYYFFLKLPKGLKDMQVVNHLAKKGVVVLPGSAFSDHDDYIRISYAMPKQQLAKGLRVICEVVNTLKISGRNQA